MRKILSVILVVVMLAALVTVMPTSASAALPDLVITEVEVDTTGWSGNGSDSSDAYEFIEIYNAGSTSVNLYDYSMVMSESATAGSDPSGLLIDRVNPIQAAGSYGTICTANYEDNAKYYVTNPTTAVLEPGKTAVIWFYTFDAVKHAINVKKEAITFDEFKSYYRMNAYSDAALEDILVVAVDANGKGKDTTDKTVYTPTEKLSGTFAWGGTNNHDTDASGFTGRFNLYNSNTKCYGIIKTADIAKDATTGEPTTTIGECVSFAYVNYNDKDATKNLMYASCRSVASGAYNGSIADVTYNFVYSNEASKYANGKAAGNMKYADWDVCQFATPGKLLASQVKNFTDNGSTPSENIAYVQNRVITNADSIQYTAYSQNFTGMADSTDSEAILKLLGWEKTYYLNNGGTIRYAIENEKLVVNNLDVDGNGDGDVDGGEAEGDIDSTDGIVSVYPSLKMEKIARSDYTVEYDITYTDANENLRYCAFIYNFNLKTSYDIFILRVNGAGNNQRRIGGSTYITYDSASSVYYAANKDADSTLTSIVNKITNGEQSVKTTTSTNMFNFTDEQKADYAPLLGKTLSVRIEVNQVTGPKFYINNVLVSECATALTDPANPDSDKYCTNPYWGAQTNYNEFNIGFFVSQRVKATIDNIKVTGYVNEYTEADMLRAYTNADTQEPATGDATIYVVVAMAVSFISLAALVVVKKKSSVK